MLFNAFLTGYLLEANSHCSALYPDERPSAHAYSYTVLVAKATNNVHPPSREVQTTQAMERGPGF